MRKIICLFIATVALVSCGSDDDPVYYPPTVTVPNKITMTAGSDIEVYTISYDGLHRISGMNVISDGDPDLGYTFQYNSDNQITQVNRTGSTAQLKFTYDANKRLATYQLDNAPANNFGYDQATDLYSSSVYHFGYLGTGDFRVVGNDLYHYETADGAFANVNSNYQLIGLFMDNQFLYFATKMAIDFIGPTGDPHDLEFNNNVQDGLLKKTQISGAFTMQLEYEYISVY